MLQNNKNKFKHLLIFSVDHCSSGRKPGPEQPSVCPFIGIQTGLDNPKLFFLNYGATDLI